MRFFLSIFEISGLNWHIRYPIIGTVKKKLEKGRYQFASSYSKWFNSLDHQRLQYCKPCLDWAFVDVIVVLFISRRDTLWAGYWLFQGFMLFQDAYMCKGSSIWFGICISETIGNRFRVCLCLYRKEQRSAANSLKLMALQPVQEMLHLFKQYTIENYYYQIWNFKL